MTTLVTSSYGVEEEETELLALSLPGEVAWMWSGTVQQLHHCVFWSHRCMTVLTIDWRREVQLLIGLLLAL